MRKLIFIAVILALSGLNAYLYRSNQDLSKEGRNQAIRIEKLEEDAESAKQYEELLALYFEGLSGEVSETTVTEFDQRMANLNDQETVRRYGELKDEQNVDELVQFGKYLNAQALTFLKDE